MLGASVLSPLAARAVEPARFHHVHLNVVDPAGSLKFYADTFGAVPVKFAGVADAAFTERSFILFNQVGSPAPAALASGIWHIGWGGVDVPKEYEWFRAKGVKIHTPLYALGRGHVVYLQGLDDEVIEVNTMGHHRFGHVHLLAADVNAACQWYADHLGVDLPRRVVPKPPDMTQVRAWSNSFRCDNVSFVVYGRPDYEPIPPWWKDEKLTSLAPTRGRVIDHVAFSYREIEPVLARLQASGVVIVEPLALRPEFKFRSFYVLAPDDVLIEIVEARPVPEGIWD